MSQFQKGSPVQPILQASFSNPHDGNFSYQRVLIVLDTGADSSVLPKWLADSLMHQNGKKVKKETCFGIGGNSAIFRHTFDVDIHKPNSTEILFSLKNRKFDVAQNYAANIVLFGVKDFLSTYLYSINYHHKTFLLKVPK